MAVVTLPYDPTWQALTWAKKNCPSYITNDVSRNSGFKNDTQLYYRMNYVTYIDYFFSNEKEATMFALKWLS